MTVDLNDLLQKLAVFRMEAMAANQLPTRRVFLMLADEVIEELTSLRLRVATLQVEAATPLYYCDDKLVDENERLRAEVVALHGENADVMKQINWAHKVMHDLDDARAEVAAMHGVVTAAREHVDTPHNHIRFLEVALKALAEARKS